MEAEANYTALLNAVAEHYPDNPNNVPIPWLVIFWTIITFEFAVLLAFWVLLRNGFLDAWLYPCPFRFVPFLNDLYIDVTEEFFSEGLPADVQANAQFRIDMEKVEGRHRKRAKKRKGKGAKEETEAAQPQKTETEPPNKTSESTKQTGGTNTDGTCDSTALESEHVRPNAQAVPAGGKSKSAPININNTGL